MNAYIISWFGKKEIREKRKEIHNTQVEWLLASPNIKKIIIFTQDYKKGEKIDHPRIQYIDSTEKKILNGASARNVLLKEFYNSDEDWGVLLDNDTILYDHFSGNNIFKEIEEITDPQMDFVDGVIAFDPKKSPFNKFYKEHKEDVDNNLYLHITVAAQCACMVYRNIKKHKNKEIYFNPELKALEDIDFGVKLAKADLGIYISRNIILKEMGSVVSTLYKDVEERKLDYDGYLTKLCDSNNIDRTEGRANFSKMRNKQKKSTLLVQKSGGQCKTSIDNFL